ncbi:hypothetical protein F4779DRAFT_626390 [Xylariaceae sp. FL0662B]|nr:hypothetical protein F4779DRAFT_626390 [Xylariaceae sp. FL0662B]
MSRSLDSELIAQLKHEDPNVVYDDISTLLTNLPDNELLEIEFLGKSHPLQPGVNFLRDGAAVALPKLRLVQAFFVARQILQKHQERKPKMVNTETMAATAVVLLMDPEHLTAANVRKRAIVSTMEKGKPDELALRREKQFVDSLLTSRLHRHTKSPTLWSHRRWLLQLFSVYGVSVDPERDITEIVMVAGIRHPRNYTAWHHARFLLHLRLQLAEAIASRVKDFCLKNHQDVSGWSFLSYAIEAVTDGERRRQICSSLLAEILGTTDSFRWANESVWVFLRNLATTELVGDHQFESVVTLNKKLASLTPIDSPQWRALDAARRWCDEYRPQSVSTETIDA